MTLLQPFLELSVNSIPTEDFLLQICRRWVEKKKTVMVYGYSLDNINEAKYPHNKKPESKEKNRTKVCNLTKNSKS